MLTKAFASLAAVVLGAGLLVSQAHAKCPRGCKAQIRTEFKTCKAACPKGKAGSDCKKACKTTRKDETARCKAATNPTPPTCSASGAFVD